jgi:hypothetical protein
LRIQAYRRRRGWSAWQTAALGRFTWSKYSSGIPPLHQMMDLPPPKEAAQGIEDMRKAMMSWVAATGGKQAQN